MQHHPRILKLNIATTTSSAYSANSQFLGPQHHAKGHSEVSGAAWAPHPFQPHVTVSHTKILRKSLFKDRTSMLEMLCFAYTALVRRSEDKTNAGGTVLCY